MEHNDWAGLFHKFTNKKLDFNKHGHLFTKVAFDVFQMNSSPIESLWTLEADEDGKQYLVATYDDGAIVAAASTWQTFSNKEASTVTLMYKDCPVYKFASTEYGFSKDDVHLFERLVLNKAKEPSFVKLLLESQPEKAESIIALFPELR